MANEVRLIDANALVRFIDPGHLRNQFELCFSEDDVVSMIGSAPTIDPDSLRPKGRWVYDAGNMEMACSECLCAAHVRCGDKYDYILSDYCPNCGADMRGEVDGKV